MHSTDPNHKYSHEKNIVGTDYRIEGGALIVEVDYKVENGRIFASDAAFDRRYTIFLKQNISGSIEQHADNKDLLILQRKLCTKITYGDCVLGADLTINRKPDTSIGDLQDQPSLEDIIVELPFDINDLFEIPDRSKDIPFKSSSLSGQRNDFAFKKGIIRMIQHTMLSGLSDPTSNKPGGIGYLQSKHFQKRLLRVLPDEILESPIDQLDFVNSKVKEKFSKSVTIKEIILTNDVELRNKFNIGRNEILKAPNPGKTK